MKLKVAVIQIGAGGQKEKNIDKTVRFIEQAAFCKAGFVLLPEAYNYRGRPDRYSGFRSIAESVPGPSTKPLMDLAEKRKIAILAGSICEKAYGGKKAYNTSVLIDPRGKIIAKYRKRHLFDARIGKLSVKESQNFIAGRKSVTADVSGWKTGLSICFDLRFSDVYMKHKKAGTDIICVPSAFTQMTGRAHWEILLRARAVENMCYVLAPNQVGKDGRGVASYGNSMIIDPWGKILARASGKREEIIYAELSKTEIKKKRRILGFNC